MKPRCNPSNERIKRRYFAYMGEAARYGREAIDAAAAALAQFESYTSFRDFGRFHPEQAIGFKRWLRSRQSLRDGKPLSDCTICSTLRALRAFFEWLAEQPRFRSRLSHSMAQYFNP